MLTYEPDSGDMNPAGRDAHTRAAAALARDNALARVGHARRWVILGSAGLSAGFAALVSTSPPSKASTTKHRATTTATAVAPPKATSPRSAPALPPLPPGSQLGLSGPDQNPGADSGPAPAPQGDNSQSQAQSAPAQPAPSPQPGPVSGGS